MVARGGASGPLERALSASSRMQPARRSSRQLERVDGGCLRAPIGALEPQFRQQYGVHSHLPNATRLRDTPQVSTVQRRSHLWITVGIAWIDCGQKVNKNEQPRVVHMHADFVLELILEFSPCGQCRRPGISTLNPQIPQDLIVLLFFNLKNSFKNSCWGLRSSQPTSRGLGPAAIQLPSGRSRA